MDGSKILVTGGTGSFGNAFVRHVLDNYDPERIVIFSRDEFKQDQMAKKFDHHPKLRFFIGDVRDEERLKFAAKGIDTIFHAAAMKQVVASEYNPIECVKTNIIGGENVIRAALALGTKKVVAISTDKAVKPINLYGSTKACMEKLFVAANHLAGSAPTRFSCVRYGNVIGSRGSVIPLFLAQRPHGKLTITDDRMTRYWLRIEDGVEFVAHCHKIMRGGEIFVKKVPSMKITDLAASMAPECKVKVVGIRPGEKLHESMVAAEEAPVTVEFNKFFVIKPQIKLWDDCGYDEYEGEIGRAVPAGFTYTSQNNNEWLEGDEILDLIAATNVVSG